MKSFVFWLLSVTFLVCQPVMAANKDKGSENAKAISKLQTMVKDATAERDKLKTDIAKMTTDLDQVKKDLDHEKATTTATIDKLNADLAVQKTSADDTQARLEATTSKLRETVDKYNALVKSRNDLAAEHNRLKNDHQMTVAELNSCESKNLKMFEAANEVISGYESCQHKGLVGRFLDTEPLLQFKSVEFDTIMQEYQDKVNKQKIDNTLKAKK